MEFTVADLLDATQGQLVQGSAAARLTGVSTDSRSIQPENLFVAIPGERFDGHSFAAAALEAGAGALLVARWPLAMATERPVVVVADAVAAYGAIAAWWRDRVPARVVGVTGSNGKTTTREMIAHLLGAIGPTLRSGENHNNHVGVPETLLRIGPEHRFAVVEMGTNHPGEIERLASIVRPDVAVITNIGPTHLEAFGSVRGVAREKGRLLDFLAPDGLAVLHADDPWSRRLAARVRCRRTTFGLSADADWRAAAIWPEDGLIRSELAGSGEILTVPVVGCHMVSNCLAAIAVAGELGLSIPEAVERFKSFVAPKWRMSLHRVGALTLIVDCYNANPASTGAAIEELSRRPVSGRRVAVLGDMLELGRASRAAHKTVGQLAASRGFDLLCAVGEHAVVLARAALQHGMPASSVFWTTDHARAASWLCERLRPMDTVLFKGSRGIRLEDVVATVEAWASA